MDRKVAAASSSLLLYVVYQVYLSKLLLIFVISNEPQETSLVIVNVDYST